MPPPCILILVLRSFEPWRGSGMRPWSGILLLDDDDWMRAQIRYRGETIPISVRYKGGLIGHLGENKWSFQDLTRGRDLYGDRLLSVQSPQTRLFLNEWLFLEDLQRADVLAPRYSFIDVVVNGNDWGVLHAGGRVREGIARVSGPSEGVIVRYDESLFWLRRSLYGGLDEEWKYGVDPIAAAFWSVRSPRWTSLTRPKLKIVCAPQGE